MLDFIIQSSLINIQRFLNDEYSMLNDEFSNKKAPENLRPLFTKYKFELVY